MSLHILLPARTTSHLCSTPSGGISGGPMWGCGAIGSPASTDLQLGTAPGSLLSSMGLAQGEELSLGSPHLSLGTPGPQGGNGEAEEGCCACCMELQLLCPIPWEQGGFGARSHDEFSSSTMTPSTQPTLAKHRAATHSPVLDCYHRQQKIVVFFLLFFCFSVTS